MRSNVAARRSVAGLRPVELTEQEALQGWAQGNAQIADARGQTLRRRQAHPRQSLQWGEPPQRAVSQSNAALAREC